MKIPLVALSVGFVLLATAVVPSLGVQIFGAASDGVFLVSVFYVFLFVLLSQAQVRSPGFGLAILIVAAVSGGVFTHGMVNSLLHDQFDIGRFLQSNLLLILYLLGASFYCLLALRLKEKHADFAVRFVAYILLFSSVAGFFNYSPFSTAPRHPVFFYNERSHFSLGFAPFLLYMAVLAGPKIRWLWIFIAYLIALSVQSLTLVLATFLVTLLVLPLKQLIYLAPIVAITLFVAADNLDYFTSRASLSEDSANLSTLVYLSGWERGYLNLEDTFGLGVGLNQLGIVGRQGQIMEILEI